MAIFEGQNLISTAEPFYGGKIMAMFGGVILDLRRPLRRQPASISTWCWRWAGFQPGGPGRAGGCASS